MTQEFHLSVTPVGGDEYLVRTERVSPGVPLAEEQVTWSVESWLAQARQLMNDPLLGLLRGDSLPVLGFGDAVLREKLHSPSAHPPASLVSLGKQLHNALFQGTIRDSWMTAKVIAQQKREFLRLRLGLKGNRLPYLPWEVLHGGDRPLATGTDVVFSRYHSTFTPASLSLRSRSLTILEPNQPLKILMVVAAPNDQEILELKQEALHLQEELQQTLLKNGSGEGQLPEERDPELQSVRLGGFPEIQLTILNQPGRESLTHALEQGEYHVLHYAGHSNLGASGGSIYLVNDRTGLTEELSGDDLAGLLVNNGIQMAVFNSCRGVYSSTADLEDPLGTGNLAEALIKRGIPAVLAMAERIPDEVALTLSRLFYRNLKQVYPVDLSLSRARQGLISAYGSHQPYWALPILYLHPEFDGYLQSLSVAVEHGSDHDVSEQRVPSIDLDWELSTLIPNRNAQPAVTPVVEPDVDVDEPLIIGEAFDPDDSEDLAKLIEDIEQDDPNYEEDAAIVSDLIRQLSVPEEPEELPLPAPEAENLLPTSDADAKLKLYKAFSAKFLYGSVPNGTTSASNPSNSQAEVTQSNGATVLSQTESSQRQTKVTQQYADLELITAEQSTNSTIASDTSTDQSLSVKSAAPAVTTLGQAVPSQSRSKSTKASKKALNWVLPLLALGASAIAILGVSWLHREQLQPGHSVSPTVPSAQNPASDRSQSQAEKVPDGAVNFATADVATVAAIAISRFNQGDVTTAERAIEALLDRNALPQAKAALASAPRNTAQDPTINFLKGRLAWQFVQANNSDYSLEDARQFWSVAVRNQKDAVPYLNALGFAYYAEGELNQAYKAWFDALYIAQEKQSQPTSVSTGSASEQAPNRQDALTAYAGMALVLMQSAKKQPLNKQKPLYSEALKLRQKVLAEEPATFQPAALRSNWMWNKATIQDWQSLLNQKQAQAI